MRLAAISICVALAAVAACVGGRPRDVSGHPRATGTVDGGALAKIPEPPPAPPPPKPASQRPRVIARAVSRVLALGPKDVYYGDQAEDGLFTIPKQGGEPVRLARRAPVAGTLTLEGDTLTWIASPGDAVLSISARGGAVTTVREKGIFSDVTSDHGELFVSEVVAGGGALLKIAGGAATRLASFDAPPRALVADDARVYVVTATKLLAVPRARGEVVTLATGDGFDFPEIDATSIYLLAAAQGGARVVLRVPKEGGAPTVLATGVRQAPLEIAGPEIFFFDVDKPQIRGVPIGGGAVRVVADDETLTRPNQMEADDREIYVATEDGLVVAVPRR